MLPETETALTEYAATHDRSYGMHSGGELQVGVPGMVVFETAYDPAKHPPHAVKLFSVMEEMTGMPQVDYVLPTNPLEANIVIHHDEQDYSNPSLIVAKLALASLLAEEMRSALPALSEIANLYVVGDIAEEVIFDPRAEVIDSSEDPDEVAKAIAEICLSGLTFVMSDFERLPLDNPELEGSFRETVGIKINDVLDVDVSSLKPQKGSRQKPLLDRGPYQRKLRLWKEDEVDAHNALLHSYHNSIKSLMEKAGLSMAQILFVNEEVIGFDPDESDIEIATAIRNISY